VIAPLRWMKISAFVAIAGSCALLFGCAEIDMAARPISETSVPRLDLVSQEIISSTEQRIAVHGGGRNISSMVLLPDNYDSQTKYPAVIAVHNFASDSRAFARLIDAERLRKAGVVVILPNTAGWPSEWQGPGITVTFARRGANGRPIDDIAGLTKTLAAAREIYNIDGSDISIAGFSQGATVALELARQLDLSRLGSARRVFAVAGSTVNCDPSSLSLSGTDIVHYEPGRNGLQVIANLLTGEFSEAEFMPRIILAKGCELHENKTANGVNTQTYICPDGRSVIRLYEQYGEHAWPGQAAKYDIWLLGRGSISRINFTDLMLSKIFYRVGPSAASIN